MLVLVAAGAAACSNASAPPPKPAAREPGVTLTPTEKALVLEAREQRQAQRAWCNYLDALWARTNESDPVPAAGVPSPAMAGERPRHWPRFDQCLEVTTTASPKMLRHTADCSMAALRRFQGDPFTPEYAAQVSRCGAEAMEGMHVTAAEMAPFVATICGSMTTCGDISMAECSSGLRAHLGQHLERAIGAINSRGRAELRACLKSVPCDDVGSHIASCLEPLMEDLLWLPG
jgi:hypothetical protein